MALYYSPEGEGGGRRGNIFQGVYFEVLFSVAVAKHCGQSGILYSFSLLDCRDVTPCLTKAKDNASGPRDPWHREGIV